MVLGNGMRVHYSSVPQLSGKSLTEAVEEIYRSYCNVGTIISDYTISTYKDSVNALVWKQSPKFYKGARMRYGSSIDWWISTDESKLFLQEEYESNLQ